MSFFMTGKKTKQKTMTLLTMAKKSNDTLANKKQKVIDKRFAILFLEEH